jgi:hypothetical protein
MVGYRANVIERRSPNAPLRFVSGGDAVHARRMKAWAMARPMIGIGFDAS